MLIRKNTKAFKTILEIVTACQTRADREQLIRLYITKAGTNIQDRISVEGIQGGGAGLFYEMNFQTVMNYLRSSNHQLNISDEVPGIYFFHSSSNKSWDEAPFEFDEAIKKEFSSLPELPVVRKKEKPQKFVLPAPNVKAEPSTKKEKVSTLKVVKSFDRGPRQPDFKLKHKIDFTDLGKIVFRQTRLNKEEILNYYNKIADNLLPYLKDRPQSTRLHSDSFRSLAKLTAEVLFQNDPDNVPEWIQGTARSKGKDQKHLICNDREHLLFFVERGCLEFDPWHARIKSLESPDYILIIIDSPDAELTKAIEVAIIVKKILDGLKLPSFVKTDGASGFHVYIPLDSKSDFDTSKSASEYICKLVALKVPGLVALKGSEGDVYGKVSLDYLLNDEGKGAVAPYSLVSGEVANVATPLLWDEIKPGLRAEDFNHETIFKRLKQNGDPFENLFKKKVNANSLLDTLKENYGFLF